MEAKQDCVRRVAGELSKSGVLVRGGFVLLALDPEGAVYGVVGLDGGCCALEAVESLLHPEGERHK